MENSPCRDVTVRKSCFCTPRTTPIASFPSGGCLKPPATSRPEPLAFTGHGPALWLFAAGALACFLGAVLIAARGTRR